MSKAETGETWFGRAVDVLQPLDADDAAAELSELAAIAREQDLPRLSALASGASPLARFLGAVFDLSSFMRDGARRWPQVLDRLFDTPLTERLGQLNDVIRQSGLREEQIEAEL